MLTARKLATTSLAAATALTLGFGVPAAGASAASPEAAHADKKRKRPKGGQCTVWANYKRPDLGGIRADGRQWDNIAKERGFSVDGKPRVGDIAVWEAGQKGAFSTGHVAFVTAVKGSRISVSEFNWGATRERYGTRSGVAWKGLKFIHRKAG